ncbi:MAG TPA: formate/nitrite transporter family protein [Candidatus Acidoferrales bacterium]|nr:formate/nitrite transporter family protein [Candidatus Acidoferrales bacterium]
MSKKSGAPQKEQKAETIVTEGPISTRAELEKVEERVVIAPNIVYETIRREGDYELGRSVHALAWSGLAAIGRTHMGLGFGNVLVRAIFAGWLIALMVWLLPGAQSARVSIIIIIIYVIGLGEFSHVIAGSTTVLYLVTMRVASWSFYFKGFFLPGAAGQCDWRPFAGCRARLRPGCWR